MFWLPLAMAAGGAMMGKAKHDKDVANENADRDLASATARYSPWTGMHPNAVRRAGSEFGDVGQGALSGGMMGMQFGQGSPAVSGGAPAAGGAGMGSQEMGQTMSPWDRMNQQNLYQNRPVFG